MLLLKTSMGAGLLITGVTLQAYSVSAPGDQNLISFLAGVCMWAFVSLCMSKSKS